MTLKQQRVGKTRDQATRNKRVFSTDIRNESMPVDQSDIQEQQHPRRVTSQKDNLSITQTKGFSKLNQKQIEQRDEKRLALFLKMIDDHKKKQAEIDAKYAEKFKVVKSKDEYNKL